MTSEDDLVAAQVEAAQERSILSRLETLGDRQTQIFDEQHSARMRMLTVGLLALLVAALLGLYVNQQRVTTDEIIAQRAQSRIGLCHAIDDMREKHNHFVQTAINERQKLIDTTAASAATDEQKAGNKAFFEAQIRNYQQDLLAIIDCSDPAAVASLFTPTDQQVTS